MTKDPLHSVPPRLAALSWAVVLAIVSLAIPTWKFGRRFLLQFFVSPFQFFTMFPWLIAFFSVMSGVMPMKSGPSLRRDEDPARFWMNVRYCILAGAVMFAVNLYISWRVVARPR